MPELGGRDHRAYRRMTKRVRRVSSVCSWCGDTIDRSLPYTDPMSWTYDHDTALANGGALMGSGTAMHRRCNASKGTGNRTPAPKVRTTRDW